MDGTTALDPDDDELDQLVISKMTDYPPLPISFLGTAYFLPWMGHLLAVITETCSELDQTFSNSTKAIEQVRLTNDLQNVLFEAWQNERFQKIRGLDFLQPKPDSLSPPLTFTSSHQEASATAKAWNTEFVGEYHTMLKNTVDSVANGLTKGEKGSYQNTFAIVQSSGTGKSRTVHEMAGLIFTLPFNLRSRTETTGYPKADAVIRDYLVRANEDNKLLHEIYLFFFACLFEHAKVILESLPVKKYQKELALAWRTLLGSADDPHAERQKLYEKVIRDTNNKVNAWKASTFLNEDLKLIPGGGTISHPKYKAIDAAEMLISTIHSRTEKSETEGALLVMYFDESHEMAASKLPPTSGQDLEYTAYHAFCSALSELIPAKIVTIFLSTTPTLTKYAPTRKFQPSARGRQEQLDLIPPVVELPFDVWKKEYLVEEDEHMIEDVCEPEFMVRFGRPLFWTRYDAGDDFVKREIVPFAVSKLIAKQYKRQISMHGKLAALSTRLLLEFEPRRQEAIREENSMVAGHMRIAYSVPKHLEYLRSGTPSEPILAEAAGHALDGLRLVEVLNEIMEEGLVEKGERGELVARLLLTVAHDKALQLVDEGEVMEVDRPKVTTTFSKPILLTTFLQTLFGPVRSGHILSAHARGSQDSPIFQDQFRDACVHFTHFAKAADSSVVTTEAAFVALTRGIAWQCSDQQNDIDIIIPILIDRNKPIGRDNVTALFVQIKNSAGKQHMRIDEANLNFFDASLKEAKPYVTLVMDFGVKQHSGAFECTPSERPYSRTTSVPKQRKKTGRTSPGTNPPLEKFTAASLSSHTKTGPRKDHLCYAISAIGCSDAVYAVIREDEKHKYTKLLDSRSLLDEHPRQQDVYLNAILQFKFMWMYGLQSYGWARYKGIPREYPVELGTTEAVSVDTNGGAIYSDSEED